MIANLTPAAARRLAAELIESAKLVEKSRRAGNYDAYRWVEATQVEVSGEPRMLKLRVGRTEAEE